MTNRLDEASRFFENLYGDDEGATLKLATASMTDRGKRTQKWHDTPNRLRLNTGNPDVVMGRLERFIVRSNRGEEIFFAPTPMSGQSGRKKEQALPSRVVFGDADNGLSKEARARLVELDATLIRSGGSTPVGPKYHVYIRLSHAVPPAELERLNRGLKALIDGDKFDCTTVLRIPGTVNHKYPDRPLVTIERLSETRHHPKNVAKWLAIPDTPAGTDSAGVVQGPLTLPEVPKDFNPRGREYARMRKVVREWNGRFQSGGCRRYMAAIAIVKDAIKSGLDVNVAYAFSLECEPLLDKQEEENGYDIRKDIARIYRRESAAVPSGTLTADDIVSTPQAPDVKDRPRTEPKVDPTRPAGTAPTAHSAVDLDLGEDFPFATPNLDDLLSADYKPLEPTLVPCGQYFLLYPGKSHGISSDRGLGKTHVTIAMVHEIMKQGGRVAYFDFEDSPDTFIRDRMMGQHGISEQMIRTQFLYFGGILSDAGELTASEAIEVLAQKLSGWDLVIVDGVSASMADWSSEEGHDKPAPFLDGSKATDYAWWHKRQIQPFLDAGIATFQIDHTTKMGSRVSGTIQKGAKLTGVEYELRADKNGSLVMGGTGRLILSAVKDRVGRILRYKRRHVPADQPEAFHDVAQFVMTSTLAGRITRAVFEPVEGETPHSAPAGDSPVHAQHTPVSDEEFRVLEILRESGQPMVRYRLKNAIGGNAQNAYNLMDQMVRRGLLIENKEGNRTTYAPVSNAPTTRPGVKDLDFSKVKDRPNAGPKRECRRCGEFEHLLRPDDIGYQKGRPLCRSCASESIESETHMPRDGAEWARRKRENIERRKRTREDE